MAKQRTAPHDLYGYDAEGVRRLIRRGDVIPRNLEIRDDVDWDTDEPPEAQILRDREQQRASIQSAPLHDGPEAPAAELHEPTEIADDQVVLDPDNPEHVEDLDKPDGGEPVVAPFEGYDDLNIREIKKRLASSSEEEIAAIKAYEKATKDRPAIVNYSA